ncbi:MAG: CDP-diacylglycerol--glycerol-3-phosphate 3-phosphatidyltransferase [bacterium]|nr:MAG: CDP-diacylglycerol--glycerol-3-phosphate 3-phosphatidyltransferase [bacterium]
MTNLNLPNRITIFRIFIVPLIIAFLIKPSPFFCFIAAILFGIAAATDWLDGHIARTTGQVTRLGKLLDPIADKILIVAALIPLVGLARVPAWLATALIARDLAVSGVRSMAAAEGVVIPAGKMGKYKTGFEIAAIEFLLLNWDLEFVEFQTAGTICLLIAMTLSIISAVDYIFIYWRAKKSSDVETG